MRKRILFCVSNDLVNDQRMIRICGSLAGAGYDVCLIGRNLSGSSSLGRQVFLQKRLTCFFEKGKLFYLEYNIRLFFYLLFSSADAICAIDLDTILPVYAVCRIRKKRCIYDAHEYFTEVPEVISRPLVKKIWEYIADITIPRIGFCYTVGHALAQELSKRYHVKFHVIRNLSRRKELDLSATTFNTSIPFLLYQGALNEGRGLEVAIEAMAHINGFELWLAGDGDIAADLKALCRERKLDSKVKFLGKLSPSALADLTPHATLGIHFLENKGLSYYFSLANRTFDYIEALVPAIHPDFPEYRELMAEYQIGELLLSYEPALVAAQIMSIVGDKVKYNNMKIECEKARKELCWEMEERRLIEYYAQVMAP
ncbi:MAG: glycosyltransferase [Saprospiraceae bacterium]